MFCYMAAIWWLAVSAEVHGLLRGTQNRFANDTMPHDQIFARAHAYHKYAHLMRQNVSGHSTMFSERMFLLGFVRHTACHLTLLGGFCC